MKVALLTFQCALSYGAVFQASALCRHLARAGHDVELVDYRPRELLRPWNWRSARFFGLHPDTVAKGLLRHRFQAFVSRHLPLSPRIYRSWEDLKQAPPEADAYLCGSDQIWNPDIFGGQLNPAYFLDFAPAGKRRIAYAASLGMDQLPPRYLAALKPLLARMDGLSCREASAAEFLSSVSGRDVRAVLDPTLLDADLDGAPLDGRGLDPQAYVLGYALQHTPEMIQSMRTAATEFHLPLRTINGSSQFWKQMPLAEYPTPERWLGMIKHARAVVTSSYHGVAFSIRFRKNFVVIPLVGRTANRNARTTELLKQLGLESRSVAGGDAEAIRHVLHTPIGWDEVERRLALHRLESAQFLHAALS